MSNISINELDNLERRQYQLNDINKPITVSVLSFYNNDPFEFIFKLSNSEWVYSRLFLTDVYVYMITDKPMIVNKLDIDNIKFFRCTKDNKLYTIVDKRHDILLDMLRKRL